MNGTDEAESMTTAWDSTSRQELLESKEMWDETSSQFYQNLKNLAILTLWDNQLPMHVQLPAEQHSNAETQTQIAGSIHEISPDPRRIFAVGADQITAVTNPSAQNVGASKSSAPATKLLNRRMNQLQAKLNALSLHKIRSTRRRNRSQRKSNMRNELQRLGLCYYHATYQERANKCRFPCTWKSVVRNRGQCDNDHTEILKLWTLTLPNRPHHVEHLESSPCYSTSTNST
jgi:hypothetical protein